MAVTLIAGLVGAPGILLLVLALCVASGAGRLRRNPFAGLRTAATMASDEAWRAGHRAAVRPAVIGLAIALIADGLALVLSARGVPAEPLGLGLLGLALLLVLVISLRASGAARS